MGGAGARPGPSRSVGGPAAPAGSRGPDERLTRVEPRAAPERAAAAACPAPSGPAGGRGRERDLEAARVLAAVRAEADGERRLRPGGAAGAAGADAASDRVAE